MLAPIMRAGWALEVTGLIGLGFATCPWPGTVGVGESRVRSSTLPALTEYIERLRLASDHSLREKRRSFAGDHGVVI